MLVREFGRPKKIDLIDRASLDRLTSNDHRVSRSNSPLHSRDPSLTPSMVEDQIRNYQESWFIWNFTVSNDKNDNLVPVEIEKFQRVKMFDFFRIFTFRNFEITFACLTKIILIIKNHKFVLISFYQIIRTKEPKHSRVECLPYQRVVVIRLVEWSMHRAHCRELYHVIPMLKNHCGDWLMTNQFDLEHVEEETEVRI